MKGIAINDTASYIWCMQSLWKLINFIWYTKNYIFSPIELLACLVILYFSWVILNWSISTLFMPFVLLDIKFADHICKTHGIILPSRDLALQDYFYLQTRTIRNSSRSKKRVRAHFENFIPCGFGLTCWDIKFYYWFCSDWIEECMELWDSIPNCQFWNAQWAAIIARVVKNYHNVDWECFLPTLYARYLNIFEVSIWFLQAMLFLCMFFYMF